MAKKLTSTKARKILHDKEVHGHPLTEQQRKFFGAIAGGAKPYKAESGGWLDKYDAPQAQNGIEGTMGGLTDKGFNYNGAWGGTMQMGGVLPGAVGFTYARTAGAAPANGPYAKKTKASAQDGQEMKYYQEGLDFKPKTISQDGSRTPIYVSNPNDRRLTRYNDSLILYNNYIRTKAAFDAALANPSSPKVPVDITPAKDKRYFRDRYRFEMSDGESTVSPLSTEEAVTAPQYETIFEGRKVSRPQVGTVNFPRHERYFSTSIDPINLIEYNNDLDYLAKSKDYTGDIELIKKTKLSDLEYIKNAKEREATLKQYPYVLRPSKYNYYTSIEEYAKPVQPVVYKPDVKSYTLPTPKEPTLPKLYKYDPNTPTKFSFTYPTGGYNEQKTIYFPTRSAWKSYVEGIKGTEKFKGSQEGVDYAQATGYLQDGGDIPVDPMGYWNPENVGNPVTIPSNIITMDGVDQPLIGISDTGDVQYMEPGEDYEFDGEYVTEYPVAQNGTATRADSIILLKNAILKNAFYKNNPNYVEIKPTVNFKNPEVLKSLAQASINAKGRYSSVYPNDSYKVLPARKDSKEFTITAGDIKRRVGKVAGSSDVYSAPDILYENDIDTYFNPASPPVFFSPSILPQGSVMYNSSAESGYGDISSSPYYDPIAVSPWDMLTPQQQKVRLQKYGTSGTPYSKPSKQLPTPSTKPKPTSKPVAAKPAPKPAPKPTPPAKKKIVTPAPEPVEESKVVPVTPEAVRKTILSTVPSGGMGIFGPGNTRIGEYDESTNTFYPDYENLAGRKKVNQPDIDLLADQEKLSNFITSKTGKKPKINVKQRNGGVNKADEYPIEKLDQLLNFTNYNKPTKGGWLDKYN